ncbi:SLATT domain-containing protein [Sutcliffiella horikoshii]|uniref:SLATT domain-containing protein n=1 Tax=Sutcliffiella horikoshii TaxID=79883 RepID=UPI001CBFC67C|nr:SLATT domain-containing protein [Sutcliffiella horikoshii]UAL47998.1 SLATT domain-containing protein [Sutcliffiella horikoshii]
MDNGNQCNYKQQSALECEQEDLFKLLQELKRKVNLTRVSRLNASKRLREDHTYYQKVSVYYSVLIAGLSIWFIRFGVDGEQEISYLLSNMLLVASITLTFFSMYISIINLQERAYRMENSQLELGKLLNDIERALIIKVQSLEELKKLQRKYENILVRVENHEDVDYWITIVSNSKRELKVKRKNTNEKHDLTNEEVAATIEKSTEKEDEGINKNEELFIEYQKNIKSYKNKRRFYKVVGLSFPITFPIILLGMEALFKWAAKIFISLN